MPQERIPISRRDFDEGLEFLSRERTLRKIVASTSHPVPGQRKDPFHALVVAIVNQQISRVAAASIEGRLADKAGRPFVPDKLQAVSVDVMRAAGVSRTKSDCLHACAAHALQQPLTARSCSGVPDQELTERLCSIKGVGMWTAQMVLIFGLGRPDVMPDGDGGIVRAASQLFAIRDHAKARETLVKKSARWAPHRTLAAWFLWRSLG